MQYCAYILFSQSLNKFYIGSTDNLEKRLVEHNVGFYKNSFTSKRSDWKIFLCIDCISREQAKSIEAHIKRKKSSKFIRNLKLFPELVEKIGGLYK